MSRIRDQNPNVNLELLADEVIAFSKRETVRYPEGLLASWALRAQRRGTHRPTPEATHRPGAAAAPANPRAALWEDPDDPPCSVERGRFYAALFRFLWGVPIARTAKECADFMDAWPDRESFPEFEIWTSRLRAWPEGENYPPIPDDTELEKLAITGPDYRWWTPGAPAGDVGMTVPREVANAF